MSQGSVTMGAAPSTSASIVMPPASAARTKRSSALVTVPRTASRSSAVTDSSA
jgi:hypothetical protein